MAAALLATMAVLASTPALAADASSAMAQLPGQKIDSGLGDLPHYSQWADPTGKDPMRRVAAMPSAKVHVVGEKVDSGLGDLPHYSQWADKSGRQQPVLMSQAK
jgi:hypothetical protein